MPFHPHMCARGEEGEVLDIRHISFNSSLVIYSTTFMPPTTRPYFQGVLQQESASKVLVEKEIST